MIQAIVGSTEELVRKLGEGGRSVVPVTQQQVENLAANCYEVSKPYLAMQ